MLTDKVMTGNYILEYRQAKQDGSSPNQFNSSPLLCSSNTFARIPRHDHDHHDHHHIVGTRWQSSAHRRCLQKLTHAYFHVSLENSPL